MVNLNVLILDFFLMYMCNPGTQPPSLPGGQLPLENIKDMQVLLIIPPEDLPPGPVPPAAPSGAIAHFALYLLSQNSSYRLPWKNATAPNSPKKKLMWAGHTPRMYLFCLQHQDLQKLYWPTDLKKRSGSSRELKCKTGQLKAAQEIRLPPCSKKE